MVRRRAAADCPERLRRPGVSDPPEWPRLDKPARDQLPKRDVAAGVSRTHPRGNHGVVSALGVGVMTQPVGLRFDPALCCAEQGAQRVRER